MATRPPSLAIWLLQHVLGGEKRESLVGDLVEQYARGRSDTWFWRQTAAALAVAAWELKWLAIAVALVEILATTVYSQILPLFWRISNYVLYREMVQWLVDHDLSAVARASYWFEPDQIVSRLEWCGLLMLGALILTRIWRDRRMAVVVLLVAVQLWLAADGLWFVLDAWLARPASLAFGLNAFWVALFVLVMQPAAVCTGASVGSRR